VLLAAARDLGLLDLVIMGDSALRFGHCTMEQLRVAAAKHCRGAPQLRALLPLLDDRSESPWESVMRVLHTRADVKVEPQKVICDQWGRFVARGDLWLVGTRRIHEYDGEVHRDRQTHRSDLARDRRLIEIDWQRVGFTSPQLLHEGGSIIASAPTGCWDAPGIRNAWRVGRPSWMIRSSDRRAGPGSRAVGGEQCDSRTVGE
jgi:very-short-patch-repair endonuclease